MPFLGLIQVRCICKPEHSGKNKRCKSCHPSKKMMERLKKKVVAGKTSRKPVKPGQLKKHAGMKMGFLPWLHPAPEDNKENHVFPKASQGTDTSFEDPYEAFETEGYQGSAQR